MAVELSAANLVEQSPIEGGHPRLDQHHRHHLRSLNLSCDTECCSEKPKFLGKQPTRTPASAG